MNRRWLLPCRLQGEVRRTPLVKARRSHPGLGCVLLVLLLLVVACGACTPRQVRPGNLRIEYNYEGSFGRYHIADKASAYDGSRLVATAEAIRIIRKEPGPNQIEVEETYYSPDGSVTYKGKLLIRFGYDGGHVDEEIPVSGRKPFDIFERWP